MHKRPERAVTFYHLEPLAQGYRSLEAFRQFAATPKPPMMARIRSGGKSYVEELGITELGGAAGPFVALIVLVVIGMCVKQRGIITGKGQAELTRFILDLGLPALVFTSMATGMTRDMLLQAPVVMAAIIAIIFVGYGVALLLLRVIRMDEPHGRILQMEVAFPNTGFLGIPVNALLFGAPGAFLAVLCDVGLTLMMYSLPAWILDRERAGADKKGMLINGVTVAFALGLIPALTGWVPPEVILRPVQMIGDMSIPMGLLLVGIMAIPIDVHREQSQVIGWVSAFRLFLIPMLVLAAVRIFRVPEPAASVITLEAGMPAFASGPILAQKHDGDHQLAASATVITTLLSALTLPALAVLLLL